MTHYSRRFAVPAVLALGLSPVAAQAQYYDSAPPPPLYPYAVQNSYGGQAGQPYAIQVAPNTYVIQRPAASRNYPYLRSGRQANSAVEPAPRRFDRPHKPVDRGLVEELRKRTQAKQDSAAPGQEQNSRGAISTTKIVRDPPVVVETQRVVDDPPRIIERRQIVEDPPTRSRGQPVVVEGGEPSKRASRDDNKQRVIEADAEITILGPDRMSIRLFRKGHKANARAQ
jgi:hypothetical protein